MKKNRCLKNPPVNCCNSSLRPELVNRWKREYEESKAGSFSSNGKQVQRELEAENARLKKQLKDSELENAILKKAVGIFSRSDGKYFNS